MTNYHKKVDVLKWTNDYSYYKKVRNKKDGAKGQSCRYCSPYRGCNYFWKRGYRKGDYKCWKTYRKHQWEGGNHGV